MVMIAFFIIIVTARWRARKENIDPAKITDMGIYVFCAGIVGARIFYIIQFFESYRNNLISVVKVYEGGLVFYGGLFGGIIAIIVFAKKNNLPFFKLIDIAAPSVALGLGFARIGCFLNGCCFGKVASHIPWAVQFPRMTDEMNVSPAFAHQYRLGLVTLSDTHTLPIHPTQLYSFFSDIVLFFVLSVFFKYKKKDGEILLLFGMVYPIIRFCMELLRNDTPLYFNHFTIAQIISIFLFAISLPIFTIFRLKGKETALR